MSLLLPALGIDHGDARIGIAATDILGMMAHPVETITLAQTNAFTRIAQLVEQRHCQCIVLGIPYRLDGSEGTAAEKIRHFGKKLHLSLPHIPLFYVDERLTTSTAHEKMRQAGRKAKNRKQTIDQAAAVEILNSWLEEQQLQTGLLPDFLDREPPLF